MKGLTKLVLGLVALVVILIATAGILLGVYFEPSDYKSDIEQLALDKTGLQLSIDGDIDWSVFPWLGLRISQVRVQYPQQAALASLEQAQVSVKVLPLLSGQVQMSDIVVQGLDLSLVQTADGGNNWSSPARDRAPVQDRASEGDGESESAPLALDIQGITVDNGRISFEDRQAGSRMLLQDLTLSSGRVQQGAYFPLQLSFRLEQSAANAGSPALSADARLKAEVQLDPKTQQYRIRGLDSSMQLQFAQLGAKPVEIKLTGDVAADMIAQQARIDNLSLAAAGLSVTGSLSVQDFARPILGGELKLAEFNPRNLLAALGQPIPALQDETALTRLSLSAALNGPANSLTLKPLALTLDDTQFSGALAYGLGNGAISLDLDGDTLNLDRYLPPQATGDKAAGTESAGQAGGERYSREEVIPVEPLKKLALDAQFRLKQLQVAGMILGDVDLAVSAQNGLLKLPRINASLFGGNLRNSAVLDVRATPVKLSVSKNISGLQMGDLLQALNPDTRPVMTGTLSGKSAMTAQGRSVHAMVNSLNGTATFNVADGTLSGIDMAQTVCQGFNTIGSLGVNTQQVDKSTPFANLGGNFTIRNGVVSNQDLQASLDAIAVKGRGTVDLPQALVDYRLGLSIQENLFKQSCSVNNKIQGVEWPVNCKGAFDTPPAQLCRPDLSVFEDLIKQQVKEKVQQKVEQEVEKKLQEKLGDEAKGLLKGLFGN